MPDNDNRLIDIEKKVAGMEVLVTRFDTALDKISEVSLNVSKLLAVHEQRLEASEEAAKMLRLDHQSTANELHSRVTSSEQRLRTEMSDQQKEILGEIKSLRSDIDELGEDLTQKNEDTRVALKSDIEAVSGRVSKLERLAYIVIGGAAVIGFLLSQAIGVLQLFG